MKLPKNTIWKQDNNSDLYGDIWSSWNLNLSDESGKLKTTRTLAVARSVDDGSANYVSGIGLAVAFRYYNGQHFAATNGTISKTGTSRTGAWGLDTTTDKPTTVSSRYSDMEVFNERLYVSLSGTSLARLDTSTWLNGGVAITGAASNVPKPMCVYGDRLYVGATAGGINSMSTAESFGATIGTSSSTLQLTNPTSNTITFLRATSNRIWIGTVNRNGGKGHIYAWDGQQTSVNESYRLESSGAMAGVVKDDVLYVMDNDGRLLAFNGGTFAEIDRLPIKDGEYLKFALGEYNERWIHPNGMTVKDGAILILINNEYRGSTATFEENVPSGIWEWTRETGFYHKYSLSYTNDNETSIRDYGQHRISLAGAVSYIKSSSTSATDNGSLLASAQLFTNASTTDNMIFIDDLNNTVQKYGYFITPKIFSNNIDDIWQKIFLRIKKISSGDEIVVKYRTEDSDPLDIAITTWSGSNSVRTSTTITGYDAGDEIEFTQGEGSGKCFTILSTSDLGGGVTEIVLDGSFTGIDSSGKARLQHWKQIGEAFTSTSKDIIEKPLMNVKNSAWIQLKVCIQNTGNSYIYDMLIAKTNNQKQ
jgi:hypothetical protein